MKIAFVADGFSPIAKNWIQYLAGKGHDVYLLSTRPIALDSMPNVTITVHPLAFQAGKKPITQPASDGLLARGKSILKKSPLIVWLYLWLSLFDSYRHINSIRARIQEINPDIVHAMRIPFEGIVAGKATPPSIPLVVSVWGNDFTFAADHYWLINRETKALLKRVDALHADAYRDIRLGIERGFDRAKPHTVLPTAGGIQTELFYVGATSTDLMEELNLADKTPIIINPRGIRPYIRNTDYFKAIPKVIQKYPKAVFLSSAMRGDRVFEALVDRLDIRDNVRLLDYVDRAAMAELFRLSDITVSPSTHDGTPNTLLEGMACGCFPVAGDLESVREWITHGDNGLLCDPTDSDSVAAAIIEAIDNQELRQHAIESNARLVSERANITTVMAQVGEFYEKIISFS